MFYPAFNPYSAGNSPITGLPNPFQLQTLAAAQTTPTNAHFMYSMNYSYGTNGIGSNTGNPAIQAKMNSLNMTNPLPGTFQLHARAATLPHPVPMTNQLHHGRNHQAHLMIQPKMMNSTTGTANTFQLHARAAALNSMSYCPSYPPANLTMTSQSYHASVNSFQQHAHACSMHFSPGQFYGY